MTLLPLKTLLTHNLGLKALCLVAAFALWYNIASEPELATIVSLPVDYKNLPKDLVISSDTVNSVSVEARGPASRLREMQQTRVAAVIDFSGVTAPGERTFTLSGNELNPPPGVTLVRAIPQQLRFSFEHQQTAKVPVEVAYSGVLPRGVRISSVHLEPKELEVVGPESRVRNARRALTDPFDLSRAATDSSQDLSVYMPDSEVRFTGAPLVNVKIRLEPDREPKQ